MDRNIRKFMAMNKELHQRSDVAQLCFFEKHNTERWIRNGVLKGCTDALICIAKG